MNQLINQWYAWILHAFIALREDEGEQALRKTMASGDNDDSDDNDDNDDDDDGNHDEVPESKGQLC